ncbi:GGDEF domain-containing response regulator [Lysinibacillus sp. LZ02]|uniref:GGDEF domain-containing response regulator n=1 Tax=Lysinibacillus sp. LZ02 TaxID=3420668 RepID=UPI003D35E8EA
MEMGKYQQMIYKRIYDTFQKWDEFDFIIEREIYSFLHSLKGTAGSIGLNELSAIASEKLDSLIDVSEKQWEKEEWKNYLSPIIEAISFYQANLDIHDVDNSQVYSVDHVANREFILVIDDDMIFISYIKAVLEKQGYAVLVAHNGKRGLELIYELKPSIVFLDIMLPDTNGFSILQNIRKINKERMFVAIMSVKDCKENRKRAYDMGALDFIPKPIDEEILVAYVKNRLAYKKELEHSIVIDELTQVYNRKFMDTQLQQLIQLYIRNKEPFSVAIADLDYFKKVNDTYGHLVGDEVLKGFANLVMNAKREQDIFCRYGGEEFVFLMPQTAIEEAYMLLERLRKLMEQKYFIGNGAKFQVTFSSGVVEATATNLHPKKMLEEADQALYHAKQSGRNQTVMFDSIAEVVRKRLKINIIVIDDVFIIRNLITSHFKHWESGENYDIEVMDFSDGVSFLQSNWYTENSKYIILLDGMMPKMDGIEVLKKIRENYSSSDVIVSMLTGRKGEEYVLEALENGADDYIVKPFNIADVSNRIISLINRLFI